MNNRRPRRRSWGPWLAAGVLVLLLAGLDQGGVLIGLALITGLLGLALLAWRRQRLRGVGLIAAGLVALVVGGAVLDPAAETATPGATAPAGAPSTTAPLAPTSKPSTPTPTSATEATSTAPAPAADETPAPEATPAHGEIDPSQARSAVDVLALLEIKGRAPKTGYDRDAFAYRAVDSDHNGCDTRNDILNRDLRARTHRPATGGCVVLTGMLDDPYSGDWIAFTRGTSTSNDVQIDHVVSAPGT